jgi:signal transduction histidine kinase
MNILVIAWSMICAACVLLGLIQVFLWSHDRNEPAYPLFAALAFSAAVVAILEMALFLSDNPARYQQLLRWQNVAIAGVILSLVWAIRAYIPTARRWLAVVISLCWILGVLVNFLLPGNLTFSEVHAVNARTTPWGDVFYVPEGTVNPFKWLADVTVVLLPIYVIDAAWRARESARRAQRIVITVGVLLFILFAGVEAGLVDEGLLDAPYMISAAFLSMVLALTWVLAHDAVQARSLALKVTEAQQEKSRILQASLMGEVSTALAHELNQPLAAMLGNAQAGRKFLEDPDPDLDEIRDIFDDIVRDNRRARDITQNVRRLLDGADEPETPVDLERELREVLGMLQHEVERQGVALQFEAVPGLPEVAGGRLAIQQVALNLLLNALQAVAEQPSGNRRIRVRAAEREGGAEILVEDSGPGLPENLDASIFDAFVSTRSGGLGVGLAVCKRIVESRGGRLDAGNQTAGGAAFRVWLPVASA